MKKLVLAAFLVLSLFCSKEQNSGELSAPSPQQFQKKALDVGVPSPEPEFNSLTDAVYYLAAAFVSLFIVFGVKKFAEKQVENYLTLFFLKKRGKVAVGLKVKFLGWEGTISEVSSTQIKLELDGSDNFVYINPKMIQEGAIEIVIDEEQHSHRKRKR